MKIYIIIFYTIFPFSVFAQQKIDSIKIINNGTLFMEMDSNIYNELKTREEYICNYNSNKYTPEKKTNTRSKDPCYGNAKIDGFKIQIYYSKNRNDANKVKEEFNSFRPDLSAQVSYFAPDYRVLVGDYVSKSSAAVDIRRLKAKYNNSFSIPFKILCRKAK